MNWWFSALEVWCWPHMPLGFSPMSTVHGSSDFRMIWIRSNLRGVTHFWCHIRAMNPLIQTILLSVVHQWYTLTNSTPPSLECSFQGCRDQLGAVLHRGLVAGTAHPGADFEWHLPFFFSGFPLIPQVFLSRCWRFSWHFPFQPLLGLVYANIGYTHTWLLWNRRSLLFLHILHNEYGAESSSSTFTLADWVCSDLSLLLFLVVEWSPQWLRCELLGRFLRCSLEGLPQHRTIHLPETNLSKTE